MNVLYVIFMFIACAAQARELPNLSSKKQHYILKTKRIEIPGFPGAFNAAVVRWQGRLLMAFRVRDAQMVSTFQMGLVWLDDDFNPAGEPQVVEIRGDYTGFAVYQDPRLIVIRDRLYAVFSNFVKCADGGTTRRMFIAEVLQEADRWFFDHPVCLDPFEGTGMQREKNWAPFEYQDTLVLAYSLMPHKIFKPLITGACETVGETTAPIAWDWGELRGGTPAVKIGEEYLAFFHSSKAVATVHSGGKRMQHYVMGAYTFSAEPPFKITRISPEPLVGDGFYEPPYYATWKPLRVVFPAGCVVDDNFVWVTYGRQDFEIGVVKIDKKVLLESLVPVQSL